MAMRQARPKALPSKQDIGGCTPATTTCMHACTDIGASHAHEKMHANRVDSYVAPRWSLCGPPAGPSAPAAARGRRWMTAACWRAAARSLDETPRSPQRAQRRRWVHLFVPCPLLGAKPS
eukprot:365541-Chlamydomonas_euryale.AAC.3